MKNSINHIHIIGVGGIGTSALAQYYLAQGKVVSGSDSTNSEVTNYLSSKGIKIYIGHKAENIRGADMVVHSAAVKEGNEEYDAAKLNRITTRLYAEAMGEVAENYTTIAISGSHGKSTATAMAAKILMEAGLDPTVIVGTKMHELDGNNFRMGKSEYLVLEADDYNRHFHNYHPTVTVITNIDAEHLDIYKDLAGVKAAFLKFIEGTKQGGTIIANGQDKNTVEVINKIDLLQHQVVLYNENDLALHSLGVPGDHNQSNAEAAAWVAKTLGIDRSKIASSLASFKGSWRRLEEIREGIFTDYAHHPTEIKATLRALKVANPDKKIVCVFQPHQRDRLNKLFGEFKDAFISADELILIPLYTARGRDSESGEDSESLAKLITKPKTDYRKSFKQAYKEVSAKFNSQHIVVFMGAGDIDEQLRTMLN